MFRLFFFNSFLKGKLWLTQHDLQLTKLRPSDLLIRDSREWETSHEMSDNDQPPLFPLRDHLISAKAATLILRGVMATGENPWLQPTEGQRSTKDDSPKDLTPSSCDRPSDSPTVIYKPKAKTAAKSRHVGTEAQSISDHQVSLPPSKKPKMS